MIVSMSASAANGLANSGLTFAEGSEGAMVMASLPFDGSVSGRHEGGEEGRYYVLTAAGEGADSFERIEARRQQRRNRGLLPQAGLDSCDLLHAIHLPHLRSDRPLSRMLSCGQVFLWCHAALPVASPALFAIWWR